MTRAARSRRVRGVATQAGQAGRTGRAGRAGPPGPAGHGVDAEPVLGKGERSRKKLIDATAALLRRQGYHATGLSQIVEESGAPRGSLYFYFPGGKDELACAALEASAAQWRARIEAAIAGARDLGQALDAVIALLVADLESSDWDNGCPAAAVALESTSEPVRATVAAHYARWQTDTAAVLVERFGVPRAVAEQLATVALAAIEGALLLARAQRTRAPLVAIGQALRAIAGRGGRRR